MAFCVRDINQLWYNWLKYEEISESHRQPTYLQWFYDMSPKESTLLRQSYCYRILYKTKLYFGNEYFY